MTAQNVTAEELRQFVERIEAQNARISEETDARKEIYAELKSRGYDAKVVRAIVTLRKQKPDDVAEFDAVMDMYKAALGMGQ